MGLRYNRRIKICKGIKLNLGKKGASVSFGTRGTKFTVGKNGTRTTVGIPGSGLSYTHYKKHNKTSNNEEPIVQQKLLLPKDYKVPAFNKGVKILGISTLILFIIGLINILFMVPAFILAVVNVIYLLTNKQFKVSTYITQAIQQFEVGNLVEARMFCNRALGVDPDCKQALELINYIIEIESHI